MNFIRDRGQRAGRVWRALVCSLVLTAAPLAAGAQLRDNLYAVSSISDRVAWAAGAFGTIVHSSDGGATWTRQASNTEEHLFGIGFADARHGWAVGRTGVILRSRDGGATWEPQASPVADRHLFDVKAIDANTAAAIGDWGTVLQTRDGGATWEDRSFGRDVILNGQFWRSAERGWVVGEGGVILATSDGGRSWVEQESGVYKTLFGVTFTDEANGWAAGLDGLILRTRDGGATWAAQRGAEEVEAFDAVAVDDAFGNPTLFDIDVRGRHGVAVGDLGALFVSDDGGESWTRRELDGQAGLQWLRGASLADGGNGFFVGARGLALRLSGGRVQAP